MRIIDVFLTSGLIMLCGCATTTTTAESLEYSLTNIQQAVVAELPGGIEHISTNKREFYSHPFRLPNRYFTKNELKKEPPIRRGTATIYVLGDRRPYDVKAEVTIQKLTVNNSDLTVYKDDHSDPVIAKQIVTAIQDRLAKRQKERNLIDDFRPF